MNSPMRGVGSETFGFRAIGRKGGSGQRYELYDGAFHLHTTSKDSWASPTSSFFDLHMQQ